MRLLIVGAGSIGIRHAKLFQRLGLAQVVLCDAESQRLEQVASQYGISETHTDYKEALSKDINAVLIATPGETIPID